jgi:SEC-C motif
MRPTHLHWGITALCRVTIESDSAAYYFLCSININVSTKPGRNDPCYCGSGKKYKRCHLPLDEQARPAPAPPPTPEQEFDEPPPDDSVGVPDVIGGPGKFQNPWQYLKSLSRSAAAKRVPGLKKMFHEHGTLFNFLERQEEIEIATEKLKASTGEFRRLLEDEETLAQRTEQLFGEDAFAAMRFTAADVEKAFEKVGYPTNSASTEAEAKVYREAILFLASKDLRDKLSMELLLLVPRYVEQGRMMDAHLITFAADSTADVPDDLNPFLMQMFSYGLNDWADKQKKAGHALLQELGWDPSKSSPEELEALLADPAKSARVEAVIAAHPELNGRFQATVEESQRNSITLLDREDATGLLLKPEEIAPWMGLLEKTLREMMEKYGPKEGSTLSKTQQEEAFASCYLPALKEMTKGIFTPERLKKLVGDLKAYRNRLFAAGDKTALLYANGTIGYLEQEDEPALNVFLINLVARSLSKMASSTEEPPGK